LGTCQIKLDIPFSEIIPHATRAKLQMEEKGKKFKEI